DRCRRQGTRRWLYAAGRHQFAADQSGARAEAALRGEGPGRRQHDCDAAGRVPLMFDIWHSARRYVDSGEIKLIAGAGEKRLSDAPQVATIAETYPGF